MTSEASGLGPAVRRTLGDHLEAVRSLERRAIAADRAGTGAGMCATPKPPPDLSPSQTCSKGCDTKGSTGTHDAGGGVSKTGELGPGLAAAGRTCT